MADTYINPYVYGSIDSIKAEMVHATGISIEQLESKTRKREVSITRQICFWLASRKPVEARVTNQYSNEKIRSREVKHTKMSLKSIGLEFGGRDHTTVLYGRDYIQELMDDYFESPQRLSQNDKKVAKLALHLDFKLMQLKYENEKIIARRAHDTKLRAQRKNGRATESSRELTPKQFKGLKSYTQRLGDSGDDERIHGNIINNGESFRLEPGKSIVDYSGRISSQQDESDCVH